MNNKILEALKKDPVLMSGLQKATKAAPVRGASESEEHKFIRSILGKDASEKDVSEASEEISRNPILQLFMQSEGSLDPKELMNYVGDFSGDKANPNNDKAVKALLDGKLDIKEILLLIALIKLFKGKSQQSSSSSSGSLLNSLLGGQSSGSQPFGLAQPQQQSTQAQSISGLLNTVFGGQTGGNQPFGLAQPQQQTQPASSNLFGNLFSSALGGSSAAPQSSGNQLFSFLQPSQPQAQQPQNVTNILNSLLSGNTGNNTQAQNLYSLINGASNSAVNNSGQVSVSQLFNIASQLLGK